MNWKNTSRILALAAAAIGALGLAGWVLGIDALKRIHPSWVTMKANTAVCLMLAGFAVVLLRDEATRDWRRRVAHACAIVIAAAGLLTFGTHLHWWDTGIDQALFRESLAEAGRSFPGRMGPATTLNFMFLGGALLLLDVRFRRGPWLAQIGALAVMAITFLIFLAYFYQVEMPPGLETYFSIALHTVVAFLFLAAAILLARPERGIMTVFLADDTGGAIARRMLPAALLLPALIGWLCTVGRNAGLYGRGVGTALLASALTVIFTTLVWWAARALASANASRHSAEFARHRLAAIVDSSVDAIVSKTLDGIVTSWNAGAERLFGYTPAEMIGQSITRVIPPGRQNEEVEILRRLRAGEEIKHYETIRLAKDGRALEVSLSISPVRDERGKIIGASKIARDISERKQAAAALAKAHAEAEAANRAKDDFLAVLSHELRTPLTPALMAVSDLESTLPLDAAALRESLAMIRRNIELEARLVDDLLDLTRISHGKLRVGSTPVDVHVALGDALAMVEPMLREKGIALASELHASRHLVRGDAARLVQVFSNLLTNAAKFTPAEGRVTVRSANASDEIQIEVSDTGIGIASQILPAVFDAFSQEQFSTTRRFGGLGLGLSVAKGLVQAHGGSIAARSDGRDRGATFTITLPTIPTEELPKENPAATASAGMVRRLRVLLVEDHEDTRHILGRLIARAGHDVTAAGSVAEAQRAFAEEEGFDLLLTDLGLPDGSGLEVIAALHERSSIPAVAMSGYGMSADLERTRAAGFIEHIVKPVPAETLRELLKRFAAAPEPPARLDRPANRAS